MEQPPQNPQEYLEDEDYGAAPPVASYSPEADITNIVGQIDPADC